MEVGTRSRPLAGIAAGLLCLLGVYSVHLSLHRIYQVDEAQNVFMARITALGMEERFYSNGSLFLHGPMSWIAGHASSSAAMFTASRLLFLGLLWFNLLLIPIAAGLRLRSREYLCALALAATLAPMLDFGVEIRHDNVLLSLMLLAWVVVRRFSGPPWLTFVFVGVLSGLMQFTAFKSFLYWLPMSAALVLTPPPRLRFAPLRRAAWVLAGLAAAVLAARVTYGAGTGTGWGAYVHGVETAFRHSSDAVRFLPWKALGRLLYQTPVLLGLGLVVAWRSARRRSPATWWALGWESSGPEALLFLVATVALFVNPAPYPYNLLHWVPFLVIWVLRAQQDEGVEGLPPARLAHRTGPWLAGALLLCHLVPSTRAALQRLELTNARQVLLMKTAEALTDPARDRVFDAAGLVPSRESVRYQWFLHTLVLRNPRMRGLEPLGGQADGLAPAVILRSYRTDWLRPGERKFIEAHYIALADDLFVLGTKLPPGGGIYEALSPGRYALNPWGSPGVLSASSGLWVDGNPVRPGSVLELARGAHPMRAAGDAGVQVVWVGPTLTAPPRLPNRDHRELFIKW